MSERLIGTKEVATRLGLSERVACRLLRDRSIKAMRIGRRWRTSELFLNQYIQEQFESLKLKATG